MSKAIAVLLLLGSILRADEPADIKAINLVVGALYVPQVRVDPNRMAELITLDFKGDLEAIPVREIWCETTCAGFRVRSLKFVNADVAVLEGETTGALSPMPKWSMTLKKDAVGWRISEIRASVS